MSSSFGSLKGALALVPLNELWAFPWQPACFDVLKLVCGSRSGPKHLLSNLPMKFRELGMLIDNEF